MAPTSIKERRATHRRGLAATAVDLFCGAGGLTRGLLDAGIKVVAGYDIDPACRFAFETNNVPAMFHTKSVAALSGKDIIAHYPKAHARILVGCAPCQPFSKYTQGSDAKADAKWGLLSEFGRLVGEVLPDVVSMENVPEVVRHPVFHQFISQLEALGYHVSQVNAYCPDFGVPQQRRRLVVLASRFGPIHLVRPKKRPTVNVREAIAHLPPLNAGEASEDPMHRACRLSPLNLRRLQASRPGGCWRDWPPELVADCHRTEMGKNYPSVYGRMEWNAPSPTITTQFFGYGNGRFGHPEQDRAISLREGAILQSFPEHYQFFPPDQAVSFSTLGRLIGNAVPVRLGAAIGRTIKQHLEAYP